MHTITIKTAALAALIGLSTPTALYAELNTALPGEQEESFAIPLNMDMPAQPLAAALRQFAIQSNLSLTVDSALIVDKKSPAVKGRMTRKEAIKRLLEGSGLEGKIIQQHLTIEKRLMPVRSDSLELDAVQVRAQRMYEVGPMRGLALTKEEIPGNVQSLTAKEIRDAHAVSIADLLNTKLQSVNVNDYQGNPFQMDVTYRGFTASPQLGTAQGLSVFLDGVRVNEPFGDVVNWDMLPLNALGSLDIFPGSNPLFGLGTLGGALSMKTKSGFDSKEGSLEYLGGSFKRNQFQGSVGGNNGVVAGFVAANIFKEDGWRDNSPSKVNQVFSKLEWRGESLQLGLNMLYASNKLTGNGLLPSEMVEQDRSSIFTSPDETSNRLQQFQLNALWDVSDTFNITAQVYHRKSRRFSSTGDVNQDFGGSATRRPAAGEKPGYFAQDLNNDGLADLDLSQTYINNIATVDAFDGFGNLVQLPADADGDPQYLFGPLTQIGTDQDGNPIFDSPVTDNPAYDASRPAIGSNPNTAFVFTNPNVSQSTIAVTNPDGSTTTTPNWAFNSLPLSAQPDFNSDYYQAALAIANAIPGSLAQQALELKLRNQGLAFSYSDWNATFKDSNGFIGTGSFIVLDKNRDAKGDFILAAFSGVSRGLGSPMGLLVRDPVTGIPYMRDGADCEAQIIQIFPDCKKGYIEGTPVALVTETEINQLTDGGSLQLNWNTEKHKLMVGMSMDSANADYSSGQLLGVFGDRRNVILDPSKVGYEFAASTQKLGLNDFAGTSTTKSLYFSETWTPTKQWAFTASGRYNQTKVKNELAISNILGLAGASQFKNFYDPLVVCRDLNGNGAIEYETEECGTGYRPFSFELAQQAGAIGPGETEKFSYYSFNPSLGATWQADENLNIYANWSKGARTPTVIELGCAYDDTPVRVGVDSQGNPAFGPRSLVENRFCSLPTTLSGDPYLKQVRSETIEVGARGFLTSDIQWNASIYQTDLTDDIYFVSFRPERSFFQNIGDTRRRGLEMGLQGKWGKTGFKLNYALTDATFQDRFQMASPNNSSAGNVIQSYNGAGTFVSNGYQNIAVTPGNRIPGIPLHNLNATVTYDLTPQWTVGLTAVLHSESYVRGNENNKHRAGMPSEVYGCSAAQGGVPTVIDGISYGNSSCGAGLATRPNYRFAGMVPGYAVFNFSSSYKLTNQLTATLLINNLFDREYYTAGRLGVNPFSPSINGAIGPGGFNYNSNDWLASTFLAPGAPRAAWLNVRYDF
ncbi:MULTISPECIES: TonB-dependent receptor domain-containing protein [unclassified Methylophilus]|uniref:TonB-dependent receptor domain-containing protein n=1 Tax=unclassified Methylophilus TaxID=2630143 RepID=UPI0003753C8E|nr:MULTISPECIES: TonB-dependent receptor [unclassified Methylophilus]